jgi:hypothetical protein
MIKEPTVAVPVTVFLELTRFYSEVPQELVGRDAYLTASLLEKRAYRKYLAYKKALKVPK